MARIPPGVANLDFWYPSFCKSAWHSHMKRNFFLTLTSLFNLFFLWDLSTKLRFKPWSRSKWFLFTLRFSVMWCSGSRFSRSISSPCVRSVADIDDHGLPFLSVVSSTDSYKLFVGGFFPRYLVIQTMSILCIVFLCLWYHKFFQAIFSLNLIPQLCLLLCIYAPPKMVGFFFPMVLSVRDLLYPYISITSSYDFFSVRDVLLILQMYISAATSLFTNSFVSVQHSHPCRRMDHLSSHPCRRMDHLSSHPCRRMDHL